MEFYTKAEYIRQPNPVWERQMQLGAKIISRLIVAFPKLMHEYEMACGKKVVANGSYAAARMLTDLKIRGRKYFPDYKEERILEEVLKFSDQDYKEIFEDFKF